MAEEQQEKKKLHCVAYMFYYSLLFFAHWFGSARFDVDGDGDFDPEDVEAWLADHNFIHNNYRRPANKKGGALALGKSSSSVGRVPSKDSSRVPSKNSSTGNTAPSKDSAKKEGDDKDASTEDPEAEKKGHWLDQDGDGDIDLFDLMQQKVTSGEAEEDVAMKNLLTGQVIPLFIITECTLCLGLWVIFSLVEAGDGFLTHKAGFDSIAHNQTDLRFYGTECQDLRWQFWRWLTYQFTHVGIVHIMMNVFLNLILGIPLEGSEGHLRMLVMFNSGVLGGALANMWMEGRSIVVGCSGGCYSLIGIHFADLMMNWHQKKFRIPTLVLLMTLVLVDIGFGAAASSGDDHVSHTAHIGGGFAGLSIGIIVGKNLKMKVWEKYFIGFAVFFTVFWTIFSLAWLFSRPEGPQSIFEAMAGEDGFCWTAQVADQSFPPGVSQCVKCGTEECVAFFTRPTLGRSMTVSFSQCEEIGWWDHTSFSGHK